MNRRQLVQGVAVAIGSLRLPRRAAQASPAPPVGTIRTKALETRGRIGGRNTTYTLLLAAALLTSVAAARAQQSAGTKGLLLDPSNPEWTRPSPPVWYARFETSKGDFVVRCVRAHAPNGSDRFYNLIRLGYYNDVRFHRVSRHYIAQWGLNGDPAVNAAWLHAAFEDDPKYGSNVRGTFAFARDIVPGTSNTQVYVNLRDNTRNDTDPFAIFGRVTSGMDVLDSLYAGYGNQSGSGVRQHRQGKIVAGGNAYLDREFPRLDHLIRAEIINEPAGR